MPSHHHWFQEQNIGTLGYARRLCMVFSTRPYAEPQCDPYTVYLRRVLRLILEPYREYKEILGSPIQFTSLAFSIAGFLREAFLSVPQHIEDPQSWCGLCGSCQEGMQQLKMAILHQQYLRFIFSENLNYGKLNGGETRRPKVPSGSLKGTLQRYDNATVNKRTGSMIFMSEMYVCKEVTIGVKPERRRNAQSGCHCLGQPACHDQSLLISSRTTSCSFPSVDYSKFTHTVALLNCFTAKLWKMLIFPLPPFPFSCPKRKLCFQVVLQIVFIYREQATVPIFQECHVFFCFVISTASANAILIAFMLSCLNNRKYLEDGPLNLRTTTDGPRTPCCGPRTISWEPLQSVMDLIPGDAKYFYEALFANAHVEDDIDGFTGAPDFDANTHVSSKRSLLHGVRYENVPHKPEDTGETPGDWKEAIVSARVKPSPFHGVACRANLFEAWGIALEDNASYKLMQSLQQQQQQQQCKSYISESGWGLELEIGNSRPPSCVMLRGLENFPHSHKNIQNR
ncbi:hypothetical protein PR048_019906 [Dryococelus australis]|uniref:Uncharacterized protein n=1 Tax=Dryococelus australis TaxID=614101 RepID=A0ABQ9H4T5_9NEOP|nr:hypothetical protein PR048_019906 [Dryococelus australis]